MKFLSVLLFILSLTFFVLADISVPPSKNNKPENEAACLGLLLFLTAFTILFVKILKKRKIYRNE